jgi:hypothetical protein
MDLLQVTCSDLCSCTQLATSISPEGIFKIKLKFILRIHFHKLLYVIHGLKYEFVMNNINMLYAI